MLFVAVIGDAQCDVATARSAQDLGRALAERGAAIVCGGHGGVMEAACRGAKQAGGLTIGILPGVSRQEANPYVDVPIVTGMDQARNVIVVRSAQAVVAVGGQFGTLSEIGHALKLGIPVVGLGTWELRQGGQVVPGILVVDTAIEAANLAIRLAGQR